MNCTKCLFSFLFVCISQQGIHVKSQNGVGDPCIKRESSCTRNFRDKKTYLRQSIKESHPCRTLLGPIWPVCPHPTSHFPTSTPKIVKLVFSFLLTSHLMTIIQTILVNTIPMLLFKCCPFTAELNSVRQTNAGYISTPTPYVFLEIGDSI